VVVECSLNTAQTAVAILLLLPAAASIAVVLLVTIAIVALCGTVVVGWALTRASATVLGEPGKIWR
jgi:hypothetical protein